MGIFNYFIAIEIDIFSFLHNLANRWSYVDLLFAYLAEGLPYVVVGALIVIFFGISKNKALLYSILSAVFARSIFAEFLKYVFNRPRPSELLGLTTILFEHDPAFPSGHASFMFALSFYLLLSGNKKAGLVLLFLAMFNGFARVILGLHWPLDIVAGIAVGFVSAYLVRFCILFFSRRNSL